MVGMMVNVLTEGLDFFFIQNSFCNNKMAIWLAPGDGLLLDRLYFDGYNEKKDIAEKLLLTEDAEKECDEFKRNVVYREVVRVCHETKTFDDWMVR